MSDDFKKLCKAKFVIGWLEQALVGLGWTRERVEAEIAHAEADYHRIFGEV